MTNVIQIPTTPSRWQIIADMAEAMDADPSREGDFLADILEAFPEPDDPESDPAGVAVRRLVTVLLQGSDYA